MTFPESLEWLFSTQQFGIKLGLENIRRLLAGLDDCQDRLSIIHVAGTNGKGSVCAMLDSIARASGLRTGLYTSPHLIDFRERVRVDGRMIPEEDAARILTEIKEASWDWEHSPTFFEITTALALRHFAQSRCELVILETGMGGRLDATNAVTPVACVITPIAFDHTQWLGNTLAKIAAEKAGIMKPAIPVVSAPQDPKAKTALKKAARTVGAPIAFIEDPIEGYDVALAGCFQKENAALAVAALRAAGLEIPDSAVRQGLAEVRWPGRFQVVEERIVLDGAHNPQAAAMLVQNWRDRFGDQKATLIFGAMSDKDYRAMLETLQPIASEILYVPIQNPRAAAPADFAAILPGQIMPTLAAAIATARTLPAPALVTGSLFLVGEAMPLLGLQP